MTDKELFNKAYHDYIDLCGIVNGEAFEKCYQELLDDGYDVFHKDNELFDINYGVCCFTIVAQEKHGTINAYVSENSIEVYDDEGISTCLGDFTIDEIIKKGEVGDE